MGSFLNTSEVFPKEGEEFLVKLTGVYTKIANIVNIKDIGLYDTVEMLNGQQFFHPSDAQKKRSAYRKVFRFGAVGTGATSTIAHGITNVTMFTRIYGTCVTAVDYRPIPYVDTTVVTNQIGLRVVGSDILVINGAGSAAIVSGIVVLEYLLS